MSHEESEPESALSELLKDLYYPSESDEPVEYVEFTIDFEPPLTVGHIKDLLLITPEIYVEELPEPDFWKPVTQEEDWYEEEEKNRTARFIELKNRVEQLFSDRQAFRVGDDEADLYLLGRKSDGCWAGLKTLVVNTA
ncbi:nuclease A inhibitor family protein [Larkinella terrae]|uniref:Nuclease n=1 Tax=Larkinella terrae TaxID=2025311 RepID=A0A7K0EL03_9BACT|nr:nuclease A inhibitor family protein [Larkinella terrae]MRS62533.1 nuclease [Larkinella terrae]